MRPMTFTLVVLSAATVAAQNDPQPKKPAAVGEAVYAELPEPIRQRFIKDWQSRVTSESARLDRLRKSIRTLRTTQQKREAAKKADELEAAIAALQKNDPPHVPELSLQWSLHDYGTWSARPEIMQVVDETTVLANFGDEFRGGRGPVFVTGINTEGLTDSDRLSFSAPILVRDTRKYTTVLGASKTVFVVQPVAFETYLTAARLARAKVEKSSEKEN